MSIDVEGSLANPVMRTAVAIWALVLAVPIAFALLSRASGRAKFATLFFILFFGCISSPVVNRAIGMVIYQIITEPGVAVGFFGGPPFFASPVVALLLAGVAAVAIRRWWRRPTTV